MSYSPPCLNDLRALSEALKKSYTGTNAERLAFIALYDQLVQQTTHSTVYPEKIINVLIGALVFVMADIKFEEYKGKSPKVSGYGYFSWGSSLYTTIKERLQITKKNKFGYDERLFYLNEFYKYVSENYPEESLNELKQNPKLKPYSNSLKWKTKEDLCKQIHATIVPVIKRNSNDLNYLIHGIPVLSALLQNLDQLESEYSAKSYNPTNPKRLESINCIKFITQSHLLGNPTSETWGAFSGAVLIVLMDIEKEYKILPANRSALFRECLCAINQESMDNITIDDKIEWLGSLNKHIIAISKYPEIYNRVLNKVIEGSINQKLDVEKLDKQIIDFQNRVDVYLKNLTVIKSTPSTTKYTIETVTSYAFQYSTWPIALETTKNIVIGGLGGLGGLLVEGAIGSAVFGPAGTILMSSLGRLITQGALTSVSAGLCAWMLRKIGDSVGAMAANVVTYPFSATPEGLEAMRMKLKPMDDIAFVRMVNTLLELETITDNQGKKYLTDSDKEHIRKLLGLKLGDKLQPLKTSIIHDVEEKKTREEVMQQGYSVRRFVSSEDSSAEEDDFELQSQSSQKLSM